MSEFRFRLPLKWTLSNYHAGSIFVVGLDGIPWPCKVSVDPDGDEAEDGPILRVVRNQEESGKVYFIYPFEELGEMVICTGTLPVRDTTYDLVLELARGTLNRLRNQVSIWEEGGLQIDSEIVETVRKSIKRLGTAIMTSDKAVQDSTASESLELAMKAVFALAKTFGIQISEYRKQHSEIRPFWMANAAGTNSQLVPSVERSEFELFQIGITQQSETEKPIEWQDLKKRVIIGPWLDASVGGLSEELIQADDYLARRDLLVARCRKQLSEIPASASLLHLISGLNGLGHRHMSYPQQLQIAADLLQVVEESLLEVPVMVSFDFPWAERLANSVGGVHPLQIADSLLRQGHRISFLGIDINLDYWPNGSALRDPLQWIDLIDVWAQLDLPLILCLRVPSSNTGICKDLPEDRMVNQQRSNVTEDQRLEFLKTVLPMMVARPTVHGIVWRQWNDSADKRFPNGGLTNDDGSDKPVFELIRNLRELIGTSD